MQRIRLIGESLRQIIILGDDPEILGAPKQMAELSHRIYYVVCFGVEDRTRLKDWVRLGSWRSSPNAAHPALPKLSSGASLAPVYCTANSLF